jgi:hypothetical protein
MKRVLKISSVVLIAAIYLLAANVVNNVSAFPITQVNKSENASFVSTASMNLFCYSNEKTSKVNNPVTPVVNLLKISYNKLAIDPEISNKICKTEFTRYFLFSINLLIELKITNLLYPFNYFR